MPTTERPGGFQKTESGRRLSRMMAASYADLHRRAEEGAFVAWIAIIVPAEIFAGFDNVVYGVPESHAAMTAGKGLGFGQCEKAEARGYSMDICSYARIDLGTVLDGGRGSPSGGLPAPQLLVSDTNNCALLAKWFDVHHRATGVPHFVLDVPFAHGRQRHDDHAYIVSQIRQLIRLLEEMTGQRFDVDRVRAAARRSSDAFRHWKRFLRCAEQRPSGITAFDSFVQMAPILTDRGTPQLVEHYRQLVEETEERAAAGLAPVPGERYRLLWDNIAPWHQLRAMSHRLAEMGANIIAASYTYCVGSLEGEIDLHEYDGGDPLVWLARLQNFSVCPAGLANRHRAMTEAIRRNRIDGVVFASNRSCKVYSVMQMDQMRLVERELGVPCVMIDVDHADRRMYSEAQAFTRIDALLERIDARRNSATGAAD